MTEPEITLEPEAEHYPIEPRYHPIHKIPRKIYGCLASAKLAMVLLVAILGCCVAGVTIWRGVRAGELIFSSLWFNGLLVLLVVNVACCFFGRVWGRKVTLVSFGMILFHLSFVSMFAGIVYNSLFYFRGIIRLTEGESLPSGDPNSYDAIRKGRFFDFSRLKGETSLIKMQTGYKVGGLDKRAAYQVAVGEPGSRKQGFIYVTQNLSYRGFKYVPDKEGYSVLTVLSDKQGNVLYGAYVPLQSYWQNDNSYLYATGTKSSSESFAFPPAPERPVYDLLVRYRPDPKVERGGEVTFQVWPHADSGAPLNEKPVAEGKATVGATFDAGNYLLSGTEIRYWVGMRVSHEPGQPLVLASLWVGLAGMVITTVGRIRRGGRKRT